MSKIYFLMQHTVNGKTVYPLKSKEIQAYWYDSSYNKTLIEKSEHCSQAYDCMELDNSAIRFSEIKLPIIDGYALASPYTIPNNTMNCNAAVYFALSGTTPKIDDYKNFTNQNGGAIPLWIGTRPIGAADVYFTLDSQYDYIIDYNFVEVSSSGNIKCSFKMYFDHSPSGGGYTDISPELQTVTVISNLESTSQTSFQLSFDSNNPTFSKTHSLENDISYQLYIDKSTGIQWNNKITTRDRYKQGCYFSYAAIKSCTFTGGSNWSPTEDGFLSPKITETGDYTIDCSLDLRLRKYITGVTGTSIEEVLESTSLRINLLDLLTYSYAYQGTDVESESPTVTSRIFSYDSGQCPSLSGNYLTFTGAATVTIQTTAISSETEESYSTTYTITVKNPEVGTVKHSLFMSPMQWDEKYQDALKGISLECQDPETTVVLTKNDAGQWYAEWYMPYGRVQWTLNIELAQGFVILADNDGYKFKFYHSVTDTSSDWWFKTNTFSFNFAEMDDWRLVFNIKEPTPSTGLKSGDLYVMVNGAKKRLIVKDSNGNVVGHLVAK